MKYIIIEDSKSFAEALCGQLNDTCNEETLRIGDVTVTGEKFFEYTTSQIADAIIQPYSSGQNGKITLLPEDTVIFININLKTKDGNRQEQKGVELLIWLRIRGVMNHCVMYSFETVHQLLQRKPEHLILTSKGTAFVQLPSDFEKIKVLIGKGELKPVEEKDIPEIKQTLKTYFNVETIRHEEANWWGIRQLWGVHRIVLAKSKANFPYPCGVTAKDNDLNSRVGVFIYENEGKLGKALDEKIEVKINEHIYKHNTKAKEWDDIPITNENVKNFSYKKVSKSIGYVLQEKRTAKPKILHIDDQWNDGWGEIFAKMIYSESVNSCATQNDNDPTLDYCINGRAVFKCLKISDFGNFPNSAITEIENQVGSFDMDLIILDLRLDPNSDKHKPVNEITGAVLLKAIREKYKGIPVLMTTASNKVWSYEDLMKLGADAYWMKEGIDNNFTAEETVKNYYKLLWLIERLTSENFQFLKTLSQQIETIKSDNNLWWKGKISWKSLIMNITLNDVTVNISQRNLEYCLNDDDKKNVMICLSQIHEKLRMFLRMQELELNGKISDEWNKTVSWHLRGIANDLGVICEIIHKTEKGSDMGRSKSNVISHGDFIAQFIYIFRNKASHYSESKDISFDKVKTIIEITIKWLLTLPTLDKLPTSTDPTKSWDDVQAVLNNFLTPNQP